MEIGTVAELITQLGFPIACVVALGWFIYKSQQAITERNKEREDKYIEIYREQIATNQKFSETLTKLTATIEAMSTDIEEIRRKVDDSNDDCK